MSSIVTHCKETYALIWEIENVLRQFIYRQLKTDNTHSWIRSLPQDPRDSILRYLDYRRKDPFAHPTLYQPLCFVDFPHLAQIIENRGLWQKHFKGTFINQEKFIAALRRIEPIRNTVAHNRSITENELQLVLVFHNQLQHLLGAKSFQDLLEGAFEPINIPEALNKMVVCVEGFRECTAPTEMNTLRECIVELLASTELAFLTLTQGLSEVEKLLDTSSDLVKLPPGIPIYMWRRKTHEARIEHYASAAIHSLISMQKEWHVDG